MQKQETDLSQKLQNLEGGNDMLERGGKDGTEISENICLTLSATEKWLTRVC